MPVSSTSPVLVTTQTRKGRINARLSVRQPAGRPRGGSSWPWSWPGAVASCPRWPPCPCAPAGGGTAQLRLQQAAVQRCCVSVQGQQELAPLQHLLAGQQLVQLAAAWGRLKGLQQGALAAAAAAAPAAAGAAASPWGGTPRWQQQRRGDAAQALGALRMHGLRGGAGRMGGGEEVWLSGGWEETYGGRQAGWLPNEGLQL